MQRVLWSSKGRHEHLFSHMLFWLVGCSFVSLMHSWIDQFRWGTISSSWYVHVCVCACKCSPNLNEHCEKDEQESLNSQIHKNRANCWTGKLKRTVNIVSIIVVSTGPACKYKVLCQHLLQAHPLFMYTVLQVKDFRLWPPHTDYNLSFLLTATIQHYSAMPIGSE